MIEANNVARIFASPTIVEVLDAMYEDTDRKYFVRQLADTCGRYPSGVLNALRTLETAGIVQVERKPRETYYGLDPQFPAYHELGALIRAVGCSASPPGGRWELVVKDGADAGKRYRLDGSVFIIGRHEACHVRLSDPAVSRRHARLRTTSQGGEMHVDDLGSQASTFVNGRKTSGGRLRAGDTLRVASTEMKLNQLG